MIINIMSFEDKKFIDIEDLKIYHRLHGHIYYKTTAEWNAKPDIIGANGDIFIYTDHTVEKDGKTISIVGIKVGDGKAYLIDRPFVTKEFEEHILNDTIHITNEEREFWNNKVRCFPNDSNEELIFTID